ncbi:uncharacterized protein LOC110026036 [Phalaenopsis equestris]|uniref:uncharacterized protein LOC110026036 n=1 Tax=Phalaenopsis equestris TaxID=78828 RepID=UPI0009E4C845|nr:uncharacterized protein LOC110026036 [Phalaenopsis equestris]
MHRISSSILQRSITLSLFQRSSTHSPQFLPKFLPSISNTCSSLTKPFSPYQISSLCSLTINPRVPNPHLLRGFCSNPPIDYGKEVDEINLKFAEAREEIDAALESKETVYFDEEAECAREAVKSVFDMFEGLLARLPESGRSALQRSMGLKMEQLKAELKQLDD